ncbi:hypothetical protein HA402_005337 [Bradysia odoriphaga]|nr:hypothetical protein HA402_005337 [Bradysia odoriphaga]
MNFVLTIIIVLCSCHLYSILGQQSNLVCTQEFCKHYKEMTGCPNLPVGCEAQNATHSGNILPSATPCSCCEVCLEHIQEGEYCTIGSPGSPVPSTICGPGLKCATVSNDDHPKCKKMDDTECFKQQIEFDTAKNNGTIGKWMQRPMCDDEGFFKPVKCIPDEICYCLDKNGNRIFGEDVYSETAELTMNCECSRLASTFKNLMPSKYPQPTARCLDDGSFDPIQCFGDKCVCINSMYGGTTSDKMYDNDKLNQMPCYNRKIHRSNTVYDHDCEKIVSDKLSEKYRLESEGSVVMDFKMDLCELNGWYKRVHEDKYSKRCVNKYGIQIGNYSLPKDDPEAKNMNCQCARANFLTNNTNIECCRNGNYPKVTCKNNECYCLDENGNQVSAEVQVDEIFTLRCWNDGFFC